MKPLLTIDRADEIPAILALDEHWSCKTCTPPTQDVARRELRSFCKWWLDEDQRKAWKVRTVIDGLQGETWRSADAVFRFVPRDGADPVSVLMILSQHHEKKKYPHYQLQAPISSLLHVIEKWPLRATAERGILAYDEHLQPFREARLRSIALDRGLSEADQHSIMEAISSLVIGLHDAYPHK